MAEPVLQPTEDTQQDKEPERPRSEVFNEKFGALMKFASTSLTRAKQVA
jgi:hypothetical protein